LGGELAGEVGDFVEVAVLGVEVVAGGAMLAGERKATRGEERLPFCFWNVLFGMGVKGHWAATIRRIVWLTVRRGVVSVNLKFTEGIFQEIK